MQSNDELKECDIIILTRSYCDDIRRIGDFGFDSSLLEEKSYKKSYQNTFIYDISYKNFMGAKPQGTRLNNLDGFIKIHDGT